MHLYINKCKKGGRADGRYVAVLAQLRACKLSLLMHRAVVGTLRGPGCQVGQIPLHALEFMSYMWLALTRAQKLWLASWEI